MSWQGGHTRCSLRHCQEAGRAGSVSLASGGTEVTEVRGEAGRSQVQAAVSSVFFLLIKEEPLEALTGT